MSARRANLAERLQSFMDANSAPFPEKYDVFDRLVTWIVMLDGDLSSTENALRNIYEALPNEAHSCASGCLLCLARREILRALPGLASEAAR